MEFRINSAKLRLFWNASTTNDCPFETILPLCIWPRKCIQSVQPQLRPFALSRTLPSHMPRNLQLRVVAVVLALTTVAACVLAGINFQKEQSFAAVTDGAWWSESTGGLAAQRVLPGSPAERAGIKTGDILLSVNEHPTTRISRLERELYRVGIYGRANYTISRSTPERSNVRLEVPVILEPADRS